MIISKLEKIKETKNRLKEVINAKGGTITDSTPFSEYPSAVNELSAGGGATEPEDSVAYYKRTRPKNWPYFPLPSEMTEEDDVIYLLYDATDFRCCPAFSASFTSCTCTLYKYMDTKVVSQETLSLTSGTTMYLQYDDSQADYNTFNYVLIKLQGSISQMWTYKSKFNGKEDSSSFVSELIEVSGKCNACNIAHRKFWPCIKYYSFLGVSDTSMLSMFLECYSLQAIPELDTSKVTDMWGMFASCRSLQAISELDTSNVTNMQNMFYECYSLRSIPLLNTSNVTNMQNMFYGCYSLQTVPELDTSKVTDMRYMFDYCYSLQSIPLLDTSKVAYMNRMFGMCYSLRSIPLLNTSNVTDMSRMLSSCASLQSIPELDVSNVTNMNGMLESCSSLQAISLLNTNNVTNMNGMFSYCSSLQTISLSNASKVTNMDTFMNCSSLQRINIANLKTSFSISASTMFQREDLLTILNNLATVKTTQTLRMGSTNLAKLTDADKLIATEKGWTLA